MTVALVLVSHVPELAEGVRRLARQMAPDVTIAVAGGDDDGGVGTSFDKVLTALQQAEEAGSGTVVLYDLGSALLTAETAAEMLDAEAGPDLGTVEIVDAPLVEGAVAAATTAQQGGDRESVARAAREQGGGVGADDGSGAPSGPPPDASVRTVVLRNPLGLHARPAADLARMLTGHDARVLVAGESDPWVDGRSVVAVIGLGLRGGAMVRVAADGADATATLDDIEQMVHGGFGELSGPGEQGDAPSQLTGVAAAPGRASGKAATVGAPVRGQDDAGTQGGSPEDERRRLDAAIARADDDLGRAGEPFAPIAAAHRALLADPMLRGRARDLVADGAPARRAWAAAVQEAHDLLAGMDDALMADRAVDIADVGSRVDAALAGEEHRGGLPDAARLRGAVVVAGEVLPSQVVLAGDGGAVALVAGRGGDTAHAAQLARAMGLPAVFGVGDAVRRVADGTRLRVDGSAGHVDVG